MVWDEENRLRGINDNGRLHLYTYDHTGERALKSSAESSMAVINGLASAVITHTEDYTAYVSPYFVVQKGKFTKHYFEGATRVVSKLGEGTFSHKNTGIMAGGLDYLKRTQKEQEARNKYIQGLNVPPGPPTQHGIYATPEWMGKPYPSIDWEAISQNQEPPEGWPRYPRFNEPDDVPGPPVQFGPPVTNNNVKAGYGFIPNGVEEKNLYYYHPDHLGSSSYITDKNGEVIQHIEYIAFGETFVDEHSVSPTQPYLFNGKELDFETGLYYYGARYYDPKTSIFLNVDPLVEKTGTPYAYTYNNPINLIDPTGMEPETCCVLQISLPIPAPPPPIFTPNQQGVDISLNDLVRGTIKIVDTAASFYTRKYYEAKESLQEGYDKLKEWGNQVLNSEKKPNQKTDTDKRGGGKNAPHANQRAKQSAETKYNEKKQEYDDLNSKPNKTKEDKSQLKKLAGQLKQLRDKKDFKGENHSRNAKGNR